MGLSYKDVFITLLYVTYFIIDILTFIYLTFYDGYAYTYWNWLIVVPINFLIAQLWPIYWGVLHWF